MKYITYCCDDGDKVPLSLLVVEGSADGHLTLVWQADDEEAEAVSSVDSGATNPPVCSQPLAVAFYYRVLHQAVYPRVLVHSLEPSEYRRPYRHQLQQRSQYRNRLYSNRNLETL